MVKISDRQEFIELMRKEKEKHNLFDIMEFAQKHFQNDMSMEFNVDVFNGWVKR